MGNEKTATVRIDFKSHFLHESDLKFSAKARAKSEFSEYFDLELVVDADLNVISGRFLKPGTK